MKLITFYLPQFHEIPENNMWWGKGFTEWVNVRKAKAMFMGHNQPRIPLHDCYDLSNPKVMEWQMRLAKKYGIYGFCYYHYWFGGKKLLELPVENVLKNPEAILPFCLAWANEPWTKTWHGAGGEKEVLIRQEYGGPNEWREHFNYLLDFFKDPRYIKHDNKPMYLIYRSGDISCCNEMLQLWNSMAIKNGFSGMHFVNMLSAYDKYNKSSCFEATVDFEPGRARRESIKREERFSLIKSALRNKFNSYGPFNRIICNVVDYDKIYKDILSLKHKKGEYRGVFVDYDDTPRRGIKGIIVKGSTPKKFGCYLSESIKRSQQEGNEYLFINAWNEWGESNYLEPDSKHGYAYLHAIRKALQKNMK